MVGRGFAREPPNFGEMVGQPDFGVSLAIVAGDHFPATDDASIKGSGLINARTSGLYHTLELSIADF
jgi:hypothetical protein